MPDKSKVFPVRFNEAELAKLRELMQVHEEKKVSTFIKKCVLEDSKSISEEVNTFKKFWFAFNKELFDLEYYLSINNEENENLEGIKQTCSRLRKELENLQYDLTQNLQQANKSEDH